MRLLAELKRRNVVKVCAAYVALCWVVIEVATTVTPLLELPSWLPTTMLWAGIIGLTAARRLIADLPDYYIGQVVLAMNLLELGRLEEAREAIATARRIQPDLSLELVQGMYGVSRPEIDQRRNALLLQLGLE